jgi:hypothetical protein
MPLFIRADNVLDCGGGVSRIEPIERPLDDRQREILEQLFPNLIDRAYHLLDAEAILASLMTAEDANAHMARGADPRKVESIVKPPLRGKKIVPRKAPTTDGDAMDDEDRVHSDKDIPY